MEFSKNDWWKAINCGTSYIDPSEGVVYVIPLGLLVTPRVYHIHSSFLGVYLGRILCLVTASEDTKSYIIHLDRQAKETKLGLFFAKCYL